MRLAFSYAATWSVFTLTLANSGFSLFFFYLPQENFDDKGYSAPPFKAFGYPGEENLNELHEAQHTDKMFSPDTKPKILIMGLRRYLLSANIDIL